MTAVVPLVAFRGAKGDHSANGTPTEMTDRFTLLRV